MPTLDELSSSGDVPRSGGGGGVRTGGGTDLPRSSCVGGGGAARVGDREPDGDGVPPGGGGGARFGDWSLPSFPRSGGGGGDLLGTVPPGGDTLLLIRSICIMRWRDEPEFVKPSIRPDAAVTPLSNDPDPEDDGADRSSLGRSLGIVVEATGASITVNAPDVKPFPASSCTSRKERDDNLCELDFFHCSFDRYVLEGTLGGASVALA